MGENIPKQPEPTGPAQSPSLPSPEVPNSDIDRIVTAKGSIYRYLPDGTTQRYKTVEGKQYSPQTALVFVPDFATIKKMAPPNFDVEKVLGKTEFQAEQTMLEFVQGKGARNYIVNSKGDKLDTNQAIASEEGPIFLTFGTTEGPAFHIPVSKKPRIGFKTFDTRKYYDVQDKEWKRERHLGNKVVDIQYKPSKNEKRN